MSGKISKAKGRRPARPRKARFSSTVLPAGALLARLAGGDRRSLGRANEVAAHNPRLFPALVAGLWSADPLVRMRAADAVEKITREQPKLLQPYRKELLGLLARAEQQEPRWHLALMVPRLALDPVERHRARRMLQTYLRDASSIVKTCALEGLAGLAQSEPAMRPPLIELLREAARSGTPAMKARSRKLLRRLDRE